MGTQITSINWSYDRQRLWGDLLPDPAIILEIISQATSHEIKVGGVAIPFTDTVSDDEAYALWGIFTAIPPSLLSYLFHNRKTSIIPHDEFMAMHDDFLAHASPSMGANFTGHNFVIDRDLLLNPNRADKANIAIWYAVGSFVARDLSDIEKFDDAVFQAQFVRYIRARVAPHGSSSFEVTSVDPEARKFFDALFETENLSRNSIRDLYASIMGVELPPPWVLLDTHLTMSSSVQAMFRPGFLTQIQERGFTFNLSGDIGMSLGMVNAKDRDRPESNHELRLLFYSRTLNRIISSFLSVGSWHPAALLSAGLMATYQTQRAEASKQGRILLGAGFDLGLHEESGLIFHSFVGAPVFITAEGIEEDSWLPYWEAGIVRLGTTDKLFIGLSVSASLLDTSVQYYGMVVRYGNF